MNQLMRPNQFRSAIRAGKPQIGCWCSLGSNIGAEILAGAGFDWILIDAEHAPNEVPMILSQLQAAQSGTAHVIVRPAWNDFVMIKRIMDVGAQNLLIPFVQTADEARAAVSATRYPPKGVRGVAVVHRASNFGRIKDYWAKAGDEVCLVVQLETRRALQNLEEIAAVEGVDGLFIGPSDLAADMGHLANPGHPEVRQAIEDAFSRIKKTGKAPGILAPVEADARHWLAQGAVFMAVGLDVGLLAQQTAALAAKFKSEN